MIDEELEMAKRRALHFLSFRLRSVGEVKVFLARKNYPAELIQKAINSLSEDKFLDDEKFAKWLADSRSRRGFGEVKIANELRVKGIEEKIIKTAIVRDWKTIIRQETEKYSARFQGLSKPEKFKKIRDMLARKGFNFRQIQQTFDDIAING